MAAPFTTCADCRYWANAYGASGLCRLHAPDTGAAASEVARWPETRPVDGCGEGVSNDEAGSDDALLKQVCGSCRFWDRPGAGIDPADRRDRLSAWWQKAGWCRRYAPRPGIEIGGHAYWRATHETDHCWDGQPAHMATE